MSVAGAENGQVGVDMANRERFDVILMDMQMPVMDGFTATRTLRQQGMKLPIFALTANAMKGFEREVLDAGCTGYLTKPVDIDLLLQTLGELLGGRKVDGPVERKQAAPAQSESAAGHGQRTCRSAGGVAPRESSASAAGGAQVRRADARQDERHRAGLGGARLRHARRAGALAEGLGRHDWIRRLHRAGAHARAVRQGADEQHIPAAVAELRQIVDRMVAPEERRRQPHEPRRHRT